MVSVGIAKRDDMFLLPAAALPNSQKRIVGSLYGGGIPESDIHRILSLYKAGRFDLDRQVGERIGLDQINDALGWLETGVAARSVVVFS